MSDSALRVLITDDDEGDRRQIKRAIRQSGLAAECTEAVSIEDALAACGACEFECAIVDYRLPGEDGLEGITTLHERLPHMAIIMSTGQGDEMVAAEAMKRGAADYISKSRIDAVTVRRTIESALEKCALQRRVLEQQHELENFARVLAHDLRSPAASIETFALRIGERLKEQDLALALQYADWVMHTAKRMNLLIETLHQYTMADAKVEFETVDMAQALEDARANLDGLIQENGASITCGGLPQVFGNAPQLIQFLQNLIANGIKFCDKPAARIHIAASKRVESEAAEASWLFSVADNGIGIPKAQQEWIFKPFTRVNAGRKRDGTGLGLATCKKLIERHGGQIWCESQPGSGTVFFFTLPAAQPDARQLFAPGNTGAALSPVQTETLLF